jgi:predicted MFS family arabinose efflux permease
MFNSSSATQPAKQSNKVFSANKLGNVLLFLGFNYTLMGTIIYPALPAIQEQYGLTSTQLSLISSLPALVSLIFQPAIGWISDRVNRKWIVLLGLCIYIIGGSFVGIVLLSALSSYLLVLLGRVFSGLGELGAFAQYLAIIHEKLPSVNRQHMLGKMEMLTSLGSVLAPLIGGALTSVALELPFFASAGFGLIALFIAAIYIPNFSPPKLEKRNKQKSLAEKKHFKFHFSYLGGSLIMGTLVSTSTFLGSYCLKNFGFDATKTGLMLALTPLAMATGSALAGRHPGNVIVKTRWMALAGAIGMIGLILIGTAISPWITALGLVFSGVNLGYWLVVFDHDAMNAGPAESRGLRLSLFQQAKSSGALFFPFLLGNVIDKTGSIQLIYLLLAGTIFVLGAVLLKMRAREVNGQASYSSKGGGLD